MSEPRLSHFVRFLQYDLLSLQSDRSVFGSIAATYVLAADNGQIAFDILGRIRMILPELIDGRQKYRPLAGFIVLVLRGPVWDDLRVRILLPNVDPEDKRPWQTFVVRANHVHENQYGKGMWCKLPAEGHTTLRRSMRAGEDEAGKPLWETVKTQVSNKELKAMVEKYKTRDRSSVKEKIAEKKDELKKPDEKKAEKAKSAKKTKEESL